MAIAKIRHPRKEGNASLSTASRLAVPHHHPLSLAVWVSSTQIAGVPEGAGLSDI